MTVHNGLVGMWCGRQEPGDTFAPFDNHRKPVDCADCAALAALRQEESERREREIDALLDASRSEPVHPISNSRKDDNGP